MKSIAPALALGGAILTSLTAAGQSSGDPAKGKVLFQQSCALCHATILGPGNMPVSGQGPGLVGVVGRRAASLENFNYSRALRESGLSWDKATLDRFLEAPSVAVPGTTMPIPVPNADSRGDIVAFLATLVAKGAPHAGRDIPPQADASDPADWRHDSPGTRHSIDLASLPAPYATASSGNGPKVVDRPEGAALSVLPGFTVKPFLTGVSAPRLLRVAPNGDIFIAETHEGRIRVLRAADGAEAPSGNEVFADGLSGPFGIAFYPTTGEPKWVYVAETDSVVRYPYQSGDMKARGPAQTIIPVLAPSNNGGHSTRDVAFSNDGRRMFVSVGSGSNVAEDISRKTPEEAGAWDAAHGRGAAWGSETNRADILVSDPEGTEPLHAFATGIRNGVGLAVNPDTGDLWVSTNERDALGDNLVPDYITRVREGGFYGWPWYYMGNHEDPRHAGERPDLAGVAIAPDVPLQSHSASLEMTFSCRLPGRHLRRVSRLVEPEREDGIQGCARAREGGRPNGRV
jgi:glucose/arabinose dehydrogenase